MFGWYNRFLEWLLRYLFGLIDRHRFVGLVGGVCILSGLFCIQAYVLMLIWNYGVVYLTGWNCIGFGLACLFMFLINILTNLAGYIEWLNEKKKGDSDGS